MSRSKRKLPIFGIANAQSEKLDKKLANKRLRKNVNIAIVKDREIVPKLREVSDVWGFGKDGKRYLKNFFKKWMRK